MNSAATELASAALLDALDAAIAAMEAQPNRTPALSVSKGRLRWHRNALATAAAVEREEERAIERAGVA
jgi:hypothetical protein